MAFTARLTAPTTTDVKQINVAYSGGLNHAITINRANGSVLPNCCGFVHFRALELCGAAVEKKLCLNNAVAYYGYTQDGLKRGQTPKLGAIAVWSGGSKGYGHVAVVEKIYPNGDILTSNSNYSGTRFYTYRMSAPYVPWSGYKLLGFIYLPVDIAPEYFGTPVDRDAAKHQVEITYKALRARKRPEMNDEVILGFMNVGLYNVLETRDMTGEASNGHYWYKVADDLWFARLDEGTTEYPAKIFEVDEFLEKFEALQAELSEAKSANERLVTENGQLHIFLDETEKENARLKKIIETVKSVLCE